MSRGYWSFLVIAVILSSLVTYSSVMLAETPAPGPSNQQALRQVAILQDQIQQLERQLAAQQQNVSSTVGLDPVGIYARTNASVVTVEGFQSSASGNSTVLGSGFVVKLQGAFYIVTNFHVVQNDSNITVTFSDGNAYLGNVVGTDPYSDMAVLNASAPPGEFRPLLFASSAAVRVGQPVAAIGNPYGLAGSMTFGIISQLGRTVSESLAGNFPIADVIQFSAPINPGNSGGPLLDANGSVIGMTTATVESSQGVGFAIPSDTLIRELSSLVATGHYTLHPYLGISTADMSFQLAQIQGTNVTYGVLVENVISGGPADSAGLKGGNRSVTVQGSQYTVGGDIVVSVNGTKIVNSDALSTYLQEHTLPGQKLVVGIIRNGQVETLTLVLGTRPPPPSG